MGCLEAREISELHRTAKWREPRTIFSLEKNRSCSRAWRPSTSLPWTGPDLLYSAEELRRKIASPRAGDLITLKRQARYTVKYTRIACKLPSTELDSHIEVFGDAIFAGCVSTRKVHGSRGRAVEWSSRESMVQNDWNYGPEESELAAAVRAATEGMRLQSILSDFGLVMWHSNPMQLLRTGWSTDTD